MHKDITRVLITEEEITAKCKELGKAITSYYKNSPEPLVLVALLKGAVPFLAELIKHIELDLEYDFMAVSSYAGTESVGDVKILKDLDVPVQGKQILLVEDIIDTGRTLVKVKKLLSNKGAADVKAVALLDKPSRRVLDVEADYVGFEIPDEFVVGFGLDYNGKYRNLPFVGVYGDN